MRELNSYEVKLIASGVDQGEIGTGFGTVRLGVAIAATSVDWLGVLDAAIFAGADGYGIGDGLFSK